ncbi:MAG TPA: deoxyribonuclease IV [Candidatus Limnocylindrales bacterium]|nr:deoxyribonuclease IV [Candidatus Limnocylindrales bacterium]
MLPDGRRLGAHLPLGTGMVKAVDRAVEIGASAIQIFADNPTAWRRRSAPPREQPAFRDRLRAHDVAPVAIHAAYLINLAGPAGEDFERSVGVLVHDLGTAPGFAARYVNVHTGSHRGAGVAAGTQRVADGVTRVLAESDGTGPDAPMLVLENSAGGGFGIGTTIEELAEIAEAVARRGGATERLGFCIDTAHAWGAGYDLADPVGADAMLERFDALIGLDRLVMVHLNDSKAELGSRMDRHEHVGAGRIGEAGMAHLLRHRLLAGATYYLETPGMDEGYDAINITRAKRLAAGEPLDPLPPGAMHLRGSRARTAPEPQPDEDDDTASDAEPALATPA